MEIPFVITLMVLAVVLFITEKFPPAATALLVLGLLLLCGEAGRRGGWLDGSKWVSTAEAFSGFCNPAVVAVAAMFVLSETNTMIYGPGGYRFTDFVRVGVPLNILFWLLAVWLIPQWWPF